MNGGSVIFKFKGDTKDITEKTKGLENTVTSSLASVKNIVKGGLIAKAISKGMGIISSSTDDAINRLDTMNNFPKVMLNLGQSVEKSSTSIKKLSDRLTGLPTTLDAGVRAVQRFTSKNGDVEKSTDIFLAVNNAILAGGASMDIQSSALEQLSQAYAKGKPDMMEWRTMITAMPAQINQVAKSFGMTADALGENLRKGYIPMDEFVERIMQLNKTGIDEFASFEEQARNSTGGIATNITNLKTAVVRGVANVIGAFDTMMKNNNLPTFAEIVKIATTKINDAFSKVVNVMKNIDLNTFITGLKGVYKAFKDLSPVIIGVVVAMKSYEMIMAAIKFTTAISKIMSFANAFITLIPTIKSVKDAMMLLNVAFSVNPIVLIVAAIAGLVAGFVILWKKCEGFRKFWINMWEGLKKIFSIVVDFIKKNWKTMLLMLANPFAGTFKLLYDNCEGFRNFIKNFVSSIKQFFVNMWNGIAKFFTKSIPKFFSSIGNKIKNSFVELGNIFVSFFTETIPNLVNKGIEFISKLPYYIGYAIGYIGGLITRGLVAIGTFIISIPGKIWELLLSVWQKILDFGASIKTFFTETIPSMLSEAWTFIQGLFASAWEFISSIPGKIWDVLKEVFQKISDFGASVWEWITVELPQIISNIVSWFAKLPGKIWDWLLKTLDKVGTWLKDMKNKAWEGIKKVFDVIVDTISGLPAKMLEIGKNIVEGLWNGINNAKDWLKKKITSFSDGIVNGFKKALGIHSPSTIMFGMGVNMDKGFINGMEDMQGDIQDTFNGMFDLSPNLYGTTANNLSMNPTIIVNNNVKTDPLGQVVNDIKTFSGGANNDYNYGGTM